MKKVLITGANGFTGRYLVSALEREGCVVVGLGHSVESGDQTIACDLRDAEETRKMVADIAPDWVVHLAALSFVAHGSPEEFYGVNVLGTMNLLDALAQCPKRPSRILVASSANVYGTPSVSRVTEDYCPAPVNHYACSKLAMEHMVATRFSDLPIVITRPFNYTGPGQHSRFLIPKIVGHFRDGKREIELGNLDVSRDFSDVRDVVAAYMGLLQSDVIGQRVNVCSGKPVALRAVLDMMSNIAGYEIDVSVNPAFVRANEIPVLAGDPSRLEKILGPIGRIPFGQTLHDMFTGAA
ncbi:GDP-mannose 4,6-dehydratase [Gilvimarinus sp. F26214L]|uniref:GDP-mannose 4,6-dehydratase n=1 Tax=Gilvimarinus sp. DZF01 TaxID=3461371 RepID=UPI0040463B04